MSMPLSLSFHRSRTFLPALGAMLLLGAGAMPAPAGADQAPAAPPAQQQGKPVAGNKTLGGIQRGTDAAGRSIDRAGEATLRGVNNAAEGASRPIRRFGEFLGSKLEKAPGGGNRQPAASPHGEGP